MACSSLDEVVFGGWSCDLLTEATRTALAVGVLEFINPLTEATQRSANGWSL
jgi:hypothetical protein